MDKLTKLALLLFFTCIFNFNLYAQNWISVNQETYTLHFTSQDSIHLNEYINFIDRGVKTTEQFFDKPFKHTFDVYIHPNRESLDKQWQTDWQMPDFKSECWMVASGVSTRMDILSPAVWDKQACEHSYENKTKTQNLITHELVHIYHGQTNISPDFIETHGINWFIEGLATYVSGQCDTTRIADVKNAIEENKIPETLENFWTGNLRYGLSGTMVMYIENKYGKNKIIESLKYNQLNSILEVLEVSESTLVKEWKEYIISNH